MDSTRLEMFIPVSFPVEVILSSELRIVEQEKCCYTAYLEPQVFDVRLYSFKNYL